MNRSLAEKVLADARGLASIGVMITITLEYDRSAFEKEASDYVTSEVEPELVDAINDAARQAQLKLVSAMAAVFDNPTPFTLDGVAILPAVAGGTRDPAALLFLKTRQAGYLAHKVFGGARVAGEQSRTSLGLLCSDQTPLSTPAATFRAASSLREPGVEWPKPKAGEPPACGAHR